YACLGGHSVSKTHPVDETTQNAWSLYDMIGNDSLSGWPREGHRALTVRRWAVAKGDTNAQA
ncbi:MAG: hypothetical protein QF437_24750, partial [Planctomycetota bacterium]|nr:hypothetical protein [Planctomycetota bacterium]